MWAYLRRGPGKLIELLLMITGIPWLSDRSSKWFARREKFAPAAVCANLLYLIFMGLSVWGIAAHWNDWARLQIVAAFLSLTYLVMQYVDALLKSHKEFKSPALVKDETPTEVPIDQLKD